MSDRKFMKIFAVIVAVCILLTVAHVAYDVYAYRHSSIIYFVAKELW